MNKNGLPFRCLIQVNGSVVSMGVNELSARLIVDVVKVYMECMDIYAKLCYR